MATIETRAGEVGKAAFVKISFQNWPFAALTTAVVLIYWLPRLFRGFWIDEAGAYWLVHGGFAQVWPKMQIYPGQSIVYAHLSSLFAFDGPYKEAVMRLPSVAGVLLASWLLFKVTERIVGPHTGFLAVVPFVCAGAVVESATNARPYGLGIAVVLVSFWSLREWVHRSDKSRYFIAYCVSSSMVLYFHYLFGIIFLVQVIYLFSARRSGRVLPWKPVLGAGIIIGTAALPLAWQFLTIVNLSGSWKTAALPTITTWLSFYPIDVLVPVGIGLLLFLGIHREWFGRPRLLQNDDMVLLLVWLLLGPVLIWVTSRVTSYALFATRYLIYALPPFFILLAWAIHQVKNSGARFALVLAIALNAALHVPMMRESEWRTPLTVAQSEAGKDTPLLLRSGFVESANHDLRGEPKPSSYLFAPLVAYPVRNEVIPVPFFMNDASERLVHLQIEEAAHRHRRFCLLATAGSDILHSLPDWFHRQGYDSFSREVSGFTILMFDRRQVQASAGGVAVR